jgi:D-inositol-3-phosphate glycosyltransferase
MTKPTRVLFFVTAPQSSNGYSYVGYELAKYFAKRSDIDLTIFGFQNFHGGSSAIPNHRTDFPPNVTVYDAYANENPKGAGFGVNLVKDFVSTNRPDVVIVYNDMLVLTSVITQLHEVPNRKFKIIAYVDQVYLCQKKEYLNFVNQKADVAMLFTPYWEECIKEQGISIPTCNVRHGFNKMVHYPIPKELARKFYGLKNEDFIVLNLNRNQPRKRWDICLQAFADVVQQLPNEPIKLLIATAVQGAWNLLEVFERELIKRGLTLQDGMKHVILLDNPQQLSDEDVNFLYNVADIGLNTCDGEGFGLCNFQQAAIGIPQVVPNIGGFRDFFDEDTALLVEPSMTYYVDNSRDMVCGEAQLCKYSDFAQAIIKYYTDRDLMKKHGTNSRTKIVNQYPWDKFGDELYTIIKETVKELPTIAEDAGEVVALEQEGEVDDEDVNINVMQDMVDVPLSDVSDAKTPDAKAPEAVADVAPAALKKKTKKDAKGAKDKLKEKIAKNKQKAVGGEVETIESLRKKLESLMAAQAVSA